MKGYNKKLKAFIDYVLTKYSNDKQVTEFKTIYDEREYEKSIRKQNMAMMPKSAKKTLTLSGRSVDICKALVKSEIEKDNILKVNTILYNYELKRTLSELNQEKDFKFMGEVTE